MADEMQVDILLSCGHVLILPVESVILLPKPETEVTCNRCNKQIRYISRIGIPYRSPERKEVNADSQSKLMGDQ